MAHKTLITGATAGIGEAMAWELAAAGHELILTGRRTERLSELKSQIESKHKVKVTTAGFDVADFGAVGKALTPEIMDGLTLLINNAGLALGTDPVARGEFADWERMIDTNVKGLLAVTRTVVPGMLARANGHIVNLGSVAGRWTYPGGAVYAATKFAVRALSEGMRLDFHGTGLRVTNIEPGMVETDFSLVRFRGDETRAQKVYEGFKPLSSKDIAETVRWCIERPAHVNIQELVIYPTAQASVRDVHRG